MTELTRVGVMRRWAVAVLCVLDVQHHSVGVVGPCIQYWDRAREEQLKGHK